MSRARTFTKAEILDAARAASETGLHLRMHPSGEIEFTHESKRRSVTAPKASTPEDALRGWLDENPADWRA